MMSVSRIGGKNLLLTDTGPMHGRVFCSDHATEELLYYGYLT